jgi:uncharacterized repeat protein (TIGR03803 family)
MALLLGSVLGLAAALATSACAQDLYDFPAYSGDGQQPDGGVIMDAAGSLYGVANQGGAANKGAVYKLTRPSNNAVRWPEQLLWSFGVVPGDAVTPTCDLMMDKAGALYGTSAFGGAANVGTVFKLSPPSAGSMAWTETILYSFANNAGGDYPGGGLIMDSAGALYGSASGGGNYNGTIFKLVPPAAGQTQWSEQVLYTFSESGVDGVNPGSTLAMDRQGNLFGTTYNGGSGNGVAFELSPPPAGQTAWTEKTLYTFNGSVSGGHPGAGLAISGRDVLYGTTSTGGAFNYGTVFALTPPAGGTAWRFDLIHTFAGSPDGASTSAPVTLDPAGDLYGATPVGGNSQYSLYGNGTVFKLARPATPNGAWTETRYAPFDSVSTGEMPRAGVIIGTDHLLYGIGNGGYFSGGTVFKLSEEQLK